MSTVLIPKADTPQLGLEDLKHLMRAVNETTERLQGTHVALQQDVARLQGELAEANAQLRRSRALAALGEMAAGIAHEVRNPLASIGLYVQMLGEDLADRPQQVELCTKIARAVDRLDAIVRDVLSFARDNRVSTRPCTAQQLFDEALESCRPALAAAGVSVAGPGPDEAAVSLEVDTGLVVQALANVIRNAAEAMAEAGTSRREISLSAARKARRAPQGGRPARVVLAVADTGPGISADVLERMFNPFFTTRRTGTGLGLAIVHRIVDAHGGHVAVANRAGGGSTVELCLPPRPVGSNGCDPDTE
ncbi:MAG: sensor histidine kinase [Planctomycetota bacterium]|jgi:two-component system sensor histidine kinase HydH